MRFDESGVPVVESDEQAAELLSWLEEVVAGSPPVPQPRWLTEWLLRFPASEWRSMLSTSIPVKVGIALARREDQTREALRVSHERLDGIAKVCDDITLSASYTAEQAVERLVERRNGFERERATFLQLIDEARRGAAMAEGEPTSKPAAAYAHEDGDFSRQCRNQWCRCNQ